MTPIHMEIYNMISALSAAECNEWFSSISFVLKIFFYLLSLLLLLVAVAVAVVVFYGDSCGGDGGCQWHLCTYVNGNGGKQIFMMNKNTKASHDTTFFFFFLLILNIEFIQLQLLIV